MRRPIASRSASALADACAAANCGTRVRAAASTQRPAARAGDRCAALPAHGALAAVAALFEAAPPPSFALATRGRRAVGGRGADRSEGVHAAVAEMRVAALVLRVERRVLQDARGCLRRQRRVGREHQRGHAGDHGAGHGGARIRPCTGRTSRWWECRSRARPGRRTRLRWKRMRPDPLRRWPPPRGCTASPPTGRTQPQLPDGATTSAPWLYAYSAAARIAALATTPSRLRFTTRAP